MGSQINLISAALLLLVQLNDSKFFLIDWLMDEDHQTAQTTETGDLTFTCFWMFAFVF